MFYTTKTRTKTLTFVDTVCVTHRSDTGRYVCVAASEKIFGGRVLTVGMEEGKRNSIRMNAENFEDFVNAVRAACGTDFEPTETFGRTVFTSEKGVVTFKSATSARFATVQRSAKKPTNVVITVGNGEDKNSYVLSSQTLLDVLQEGLFELCEVAPEPEDIDEYDDDLDYCD